MKNKLLKILSLCMMLTLVLSFAACSDKEEVKKESEAVSTAEKDVAPQEKPAEPEVKQEAEAPKSTEEVKPKYADAEIYEKDGVKYARTEDGTEVEMTGENLQAMMQEYVKVQGTGSDKEKEILDRMQVILDNADRLK